MLAPSAFTETLARRRESSLAICWRVFVFVPRWSIELARVQAVLQSLGLWASPSAMRRYDYSKWEGRTADDLTVGYATVFSLPLFRTPQVILPIPIPLEVGDTLVVQRRYAEHPRLLALLEILRQRALELAALHPEVCACSVSDPPAAAPQP